MKLQQGQIWKKGENYYRIVEWERLSIEYKVMTDPVAQTGTARCVTKKEFCRLISGAELLSQEAWDAEARGPDAREPMAPEADIPDPEAPQPDPK